MAIKCIKRKCKNECKIRYKTYRVIVILSVKYKNMYDRFANVLDKETDRCTLYKNDILCSFVKDL